MHTTIQKSRELKKQINHLCLLFFPILFIVKCKMQGTWHMWSVQNNLYTPSSGSIINTYLYLVLLLKSEASEMKSEMRHTFTHNRFPSIDTTRYREKATAVRTYMTCILYTCIHIYYMYVSFLRK